MIPAVISAYDHTTKTANVVTVEELPIELPDVPVWNIFCGDKGGTFYIPMEEGTGGMLLYFAVDMQEFLYKGELEINTKRAGFEPRGNCIFIPGFNSFIQENELEEKGITLKYGDSKALLKNDSFTLLNGDGQVFIDKDNVKLKVGDGNEVKITSAGKFVVTNSTAELLTEVVGILEQLRDSATQPGIFEYVNTAVNTAGVITPCTVNALGVTATLTQMNAAINKIKSFN